MRPLVALVGAEFEENLSLRYLAAALEADGFEAVLVPFNGPDQRRIAADAVIASAPLAVGISMPFQHRAKELLGLAGELRERGYRGHVCAGGHFATFEYEAILRDFPAVDSVARHEGEDTLRELCAVLREGKEVPALPGLVVRFVDGVSVGPRRALGELDRLPMPVRRTTPLDILGVRCAPILGSRGCYADCSFCCIHAYSLAAQGARYRMRSPESIAREMKEERERRGIRLFIFHDDNFFVPSPEKNLQRYRRLQELLRREGLEDLALVIKCRPDDAQPELFGLLKSMGMIRAYVGIETNSEEGIVSLNRRISPEDNRRAMRLLRELDVYASFNLLLFDPEATLGGVEKNLDFLEEFAEVPFNFCRAEVYAGTPLKSMLESEGRLQGDYLAWSYQMRDERVELLFRIASTAFAPRNFKADGIANLNMGVRFDNEVVRRFYPDCWDPEWHRRMAAFSRAAGEDSVRRMREALSFVREADLRDAGASKAFTLALAREIARADLRLLSEVKALRREMEARIRSSAGLSSAEPLGNGLAPEAATGSAVGVQSLTERLPGPPENRGG
ncbi:MAG: B12-binding domain-containing radical SAM protein [Myxococcales bacterium]|nr:B12-binding domain-containing radical SAM protein [Myxococcales bacterium]